jgi:hypothetical protein
MSLLHLLIAISAVGAVAFFLAGWFAKPRGASEPALANEVRQRREAEEARALAQAAYDEARAQLDVLRTTLKETAAELIARQHKGVADREALSAAERQLDSARADVQHLTSEAKTLSDRLRAAETYNRQAFERDQKTAETWERQLEEQRAEQLRQKEFAEQELRRVRQALEEQKAEALRLAERERACQQTQAATALEIAQAREQCQRCEAEVNALTASLHQAEESQRAATMLQAQSEAGWLQKVEGMLAENQAEVAALQASWEARQETLLADAQRLTEALSQCKGECDELGAQNRDLLTKHRVVNEALSAMGSSAAATHEQWQEAQGRLLELDQLRQENAILREEKVHAEASARELATREGDAREAWVQLAAAQAKLSDLEGILEENRTLRDEVADLRLHGEASVELERLTAEHKRLRLDAELMARRLHELLQDQAELADLRVRAQDLQALGEEVAYLRRREKDLEAQLYASGAASPDDQPATAGVPALHSVGTDMEASLRALVQPDGARSAVLADTQGFLIASAGEPMPQEGLAAFTAIASEMVARTRILLPLADVDSIRVRDTNRIVLSCRLFETGGQGLGLATLGPGEPSLPDADRVVNELAVAVAGKIVEPDES